MEMVALVALLALVEYFVLGALVGRYRGKEGVPAPAMTGPPEFERTLRTQLNMAERLVIFLPALWLAAQYGSDRWAWILGLVWVIARAVYSAGYISSAEKRVPGAILGALAELGLMGMAAYGLFTVLT